MNNYMSYTMHMNLENSPNEKPRLGKNEALGQMNILHGIMMQMGRQDWEISPTLALIEKVKQDELTPEEGLIQMQAILDSKQEH